MSTIEEAREQARETLIATRKLVHEVLEQSRTLPLDVQSAQVMLVLLDAGYSKGPRPITDEMLERGARAAAILGDYDGCFERIDAWDALEQWERDAQPQEAPVLDIEDAEFWRTRVRAALEAAEGARR